jgi:PKD repeat protein
MNQMKKLLALLLLLITAVTFVMAQQPFVTLTGHVVNQSTGTPVAGQTMYISVDSMNYPGYYNQVLTDEAGFYTDQIPTYPGTSQGVVFVYTADCNGMMATGTAAFFPGVEEVTIYFSICGDPATGCVASFRYVPSSNDMQTITFFDESYTNAGASIDSWFWDFGDNSTSTEQNPVHVYDKTGKYTVSLRVATPEDVNASVDKSKYITVDKKEKPGKPEKPGKAEKVEAGTEMKEDAQSTDDSGSSSGAWNAIENVIINVKNLVKV